MKRVRTGTLVYIPANVKLQQELHNQKDNSTFVKNFVITDKPVNCLVVGVDSEKLTKKCNIIYEGVTWTVKAKDVFEINKEMENVSYTS
jgi:hypothetical protein